MNDMHLFCFGLGYSATALARAVLAQGGRVTGTCREAGRAEALSRLGAAPLLFDRSRPIPDLVRHLSAATHLLSAVPPDETGDPVLDIHGAAIAAAAPQLRWIGYLSTTGVYGD